MTTLKMANGKLKLSHQKDRPFKVGTPERQDLCSMKDSFTFVLTLHITLQELMNRTFTCISFLRLFLWRRHPVHFLGLYGSLKLKKTLSTLFHSMSWVLIPSNKGAVPPFFSFYIRFRLKILTCLGAWNTFFEQISYIYSLKDFAIIRDHFLGQKNGNRKNQSYPNTLMT